MTPAPKRSALYGLLLIAVSLALGFGVAEAVLRRFAPVSFMKPPSAYQGDEWRTLLHRRSRIPGLDYELQPNASGERDGIPIRTNSLSLRDREPAPRTPGLRRVIAVGDSVTFGFGVRQQKTYAKVLERLLAAGTSGPVEVLNAGVGGYSTHDESLLLRHRLASLEPDLVILGYVLNDPEIDPVQPLHAYFAPVALWQRSHLLRKIAELLYDRRERGKGASYPRRLHADPRKWKSVLRAFDDMREVAREHRFRILLVQFPEIAARRWPPRYALADVHAQVAAAARARGFEVLDLTSAFRRYPAKDLRISRHDGHPTALGHRIAAEEIYGYLRLHPELLPGPGLSPLPPPTATPPAPAP